MKNYIRCYGNLDDFYQGRAVAFWSLGEHGSVIVKDRKDAFVFHNINCASRADLIPGKNCKPDYPYQWVEEVADNG